MTTEIGRTQCLRKLVELREAGGYDLPAAVVEAYELTKKVAALPIQSAAAFLHEDAAVAVLAAVGKGATPNLVDLGAQVRKAIEAATNTEHANRILATAREKADYSALAEMQRRADDVVVGNLRSAFEATLDTARRHAATLGSHPTDPGSIVTAPAKVRSAWSSLRDSAQQYRVLRQARQLANDAGLRVAEHDLQDQYATFRDPFGFFPERRGTSMPMPPYPSSDVDLVLWLVVGVGAKAKPWLPTAQEQDQAWLDEYGEQSERRRVAHDQALAVMGR